MSASFGDKCKNVINVVHVYLMYIIKSIINIYIYSFWVYSGDLYITQ